MNEESVHDVTSDDGAAAVLALVTGGSKRLGAQFVRALVEEGFDVAFSYHRGHEEAHALVEELTASGAQVGAYEADLRMAGAVEGLVESVESDFGPIGLLVNSAGVIPEADIETASAVDFDEAIAVNLRAPYLLSLEVGRRMRERGEGGIVNIASTGGLKPYRKHLSYSISKAGLVMATQALAASLAPQVTVNAIAPGTIWLEGEDTPENKPTAERIPLGAYGEAADVCDALLYLATAPYVTGQVVAVDGGWSL